jgi:hypothetical protein
MKKSHALALLAAFLVPGLLVSGCTMTEDSKLAQPYNDAPVSGQNKDSALIITMPDGFSNVAAKCDGTTRVYVVFHNDNPYGGIAISPNDPACS